MPDTTARMLDPRAIHLSAHAAGRDDAVRQCARVLADAGAVTSDYATAMLEREASISTYLGEGVAIPHGTAAGKDAVLRDALAVLRFPDGVDWNGEQVIVCIAIAARGDGHIEILAELAEVLMDPGRARALREATAVEEVVRLLTPDSRAGHEPDRGPTP